LPASVVATKVRARLVKLRLFVAFTGSDRLELAPGEKDHWTPLFLSIVKHPCPKLARTPLIIGSSMLRPTWL
jgi:hypothetical protein